METTMKKIPINDIIQFLGNNCEFIGTTDFLIEGFNNLNNAEVNQITFCKYSGEKAQIALNQTRSKIIIIRSDLNFQTNKFGEKNLG